MSSIPNRPQRHKTVTGYSHYSVRDLPAPEVVADDAYPEVFARLAENERELSAALQAQASAQNAIKVADSDYPLRVADALAKKQKPPKDPRPDARAKLGEATVEVTARYELATRISDELDALATTEWLDAERAATVEEAAGALELAAALDDRLHKIALRRGVVRWLISAKGGGKAVPLDAAKDLGRIMRALDDLTDTSVPRYVSPAENRKLRQGLNAVDIHGVPISYEEADRLHRKKRLHVNPGKPLPRETTGWGDAG